MNTAAHSTPPPQWNGLLDAATSPYRRVGRFAWHFARGKLNLDPVFRHLLKQGLIKPNARVLDIGCGQGLLASLLQASAALASRGGWPSAWAPAPVAAHVTGVEIMPRDVERAQAALGSAADFICGDMRSTAFPEVDTVVILDVLHYITVPEQDQVLSRVRDALRQSRGTLLLRVGDAASKRGFWASQWVDAVVTFVRGHRSPPQYGRTLALWITQLESLGFSVQNQPMSQGTPFANVLLVARLDAHGQQGAR